MQTDCPVFYTHARMLSTQDGDANVDMDQLPTPRAYTDKEAEAYVNGWEAGRSGGETLQWTLSAAPNTRSRSKSRSRSRSTSRSRSRPRMRTHKHAHVCTEAAVAPSVWFAAGMLAIIIIALNDTGAACAHRRPQQYVSILVQVGMPRVESTAVLTRLVLASLASLCYIICGPRIRASIIVFTMLRLAVVDATVFFLPSVDSLCNFVAGVQ